VWRSKRNKKKKVARMAAFWYQVSSEVDVIANTTSRSCEQRVAGSNPEMRPGEMAYLDCFVAEDDPRNDRLR
jgi:hypothetical protein